MLPLSHQWEKTLHYYYDIIAMILVLSSSCFITHQDVRNNSIIKVMELELCSLCITIYQHILL